MKLSAPIYRLKREAKLKSRTDGVPLHEALDAIARGEGFSSWSLLSAKMAENKPAQSVLAELAPGDLVLLGARQGHGKTLLGMELMVEAMKQDRQGRLFTLEYTDAEVLGLFGHVGEQAEDYAGRFAYDNSDAIQASFISDALSTVEPNAVVVIDYLQALDQNRSHAPLAEQVEIMKQTAVARGVIIVCIAQIDRYYDADVRSVPGLEDVRLPNPIDLGVFDKACFLHNGEMQLTTIN